MIVFARRMPLKSSAHDLRNHRNRQFGAAVREPRFFTEKLINAIHRSFSDGTKKNFGG
jgi:hypothetical protein